MVIFWRSIANCSPFSAHSRNSRAWTDRSIDRSGPLGACRGVKSRPWSRVGPCSPIRWHEPAKRRTEPAGTVDVTVTTAGGTSALATSDRYKFLPSIDKVIPNAGSTAGGEAITITGTGFVKGATAIKFGTANATSVSCTSWDLAHPAVPTTCTVTTPQHLAATVNVKATVNKATSLNTAADLYTYG